MNKDKELLYKDDLKQEILDDEFLDSISINGKVIFANVVGFTLAFGFSNFVDVSFNEGKLNYARLYYVIGLLIFFIVTLYYMDVKLPL